MKNLSDKTTYPLKTSVGRMNILKKCSYLNCYCLCKKIQKSIYLEVVRDVISKKSVDQENAQLNGKTGLHRISTTREKNFL